ncbi:MAG: TonB-dependent receptor, partial [Bacteroidetes bacterium]|nr:TonB-dependent receptor [Bacteroidota bacterium]
MEKSLRNIRTVNIRSRMFGVLLFLLLSLVMAFAGTTGKISGKVIDAATKEPLPGVNVIVEGTTAGGATDIEGEFFIINLPPGVYSLKVSVVGYAPKKIERVRVQVDLTSKVDIALDVTSVIAGEVVITAKRDIQKDISSSEVTYQSDQIAALPVRDVTSLLGMQAGITKDAGGSLHIRGGRSSEISYMVDGVQVMNAMDRSSGISIDDQSIEELKAVTGTFNAEYGQALSGVVNIVTKKGADRFTVNATVYGSDYLSFDDELYSAMTNRQWAEAAAQALVQKNGFINYDFSRHGISDFQSLNRSLQNRSKPWQSTKGFLNSYNPLTSYDAQLNISGPASESMKNLSYFIAGRYQHRPSAEMGYRYFMPWGMWSPVSDTLHSFKQPDGELVHLGWYNGLSTQSKVFYSIADFNFSYGLYYNSDESYGGGQKYLPDGGRFYYTDRFTHIFSATYVFSNSTFLDFKGSYYSSAHKSYLYEDPNDYRYMPTNAGDFQQYVFRPGTNDNVEVKNNPNDFSYWGNDVNRSKNNARYFSGSLDLTSQIDKYNLVKMGISGRMHDLEDDYYALQFSQINYRPIVPDKSSAFHTYYTAKPYEFAAFIQDKLEFEELIINIGIRFDYFYSDGRILADPRDPQIFQPFKLDHIYRDASVPESLRVEYSVAEREAFWYKKPTAKYQLSPRFGFSFPITDQGAIHFSYGHFFQNPEFRYLYTNPNFWIAGAGAQNLVGNANLDAERTVMYEIGLQQKLFTSIILNVTGFYRDIRDWIGTGYPVDTYRGTTYYSYVNKDNAVAKGLTLSAAYQQDEVNFSIDYT